LYAPSNQNAAAMSFCFSGFYPVFKKGKQNRQSTRRAMTGLGRDRLRRRLSKGKSSPGRTARIYVRSSCIFLLFPLQYKHTFFLSPQEKTP